MKKPVSLIPQFGPFAGMRILATGSLIAMPFAATLLAEFGAEVIEIERPGVGDTNRLFVPEIKNGDKKVGAAWAQDGRNRLSMGLELDLRDEDVKEIFHGLIRNCDIYMENMVWLNKLGIYDEDLMKINPKLIIVHVSGYGNAAFGGIPEICSRASYDLIGQAYSGYALWNGYPDGKPLLAKPSMNDFTTAMFTLFGALAAYHEMLKSGKGQVVDVSQFESQARVMQDSFVCASMLGIDPERVGDAPVLSQPWTFFDTKDGSYVAIGAFGPAVFGRLVKALGYTEADYNYYDTGVGREVVAGEKGRRFKALLEDWCRERDAKEIEDTFARFKVPCCKVNPPTESLHNEHYLSRGDIISYHDQTTDMDVTAFGIVPKLSRTPGQIWRGAPSIGQDTELILTKLLDYSEEDIQRFKDKKIIGCS